MREFRLPGTIQVLALLLVASRLDSQAIVIRGDATCRTCSIERQVLATFGADDSELISGPIIAAIARDSKGRFFVIDQERGPVKVFGGDGRFISFLGRLGGGPGETRVAATVTVSTGDSIYVTDRELMRCNVFTAEFKFVRAFPLALTALKAHAAVVGGALVVNARAGDGAGIGFPLFVFDRTGKRVRQIGPEEPQVDAAQFFRTDRTISPVRAGSDELFVADVHRYRWIRLSKNLEIDAEAVREANWFRGYERPNVRPAPLTWLNGVSEVKSLWEDAAGRVWTTVVTYRITAADSAAAVSDHFAGWPQVTRVEVIDLKSKTVLASTQFDQRVISAFSDGTVMTSEVKEDGRTVLSLVRLTLRQ